MKKKMLLICIVCFLSFLPITNFAAADKPDQAGKSEAVEKQLTEQEEEVLKVEHKTEKLEQKAEKEALKAEHKAEKLEQKVEKEAVKDQIK